MIETHFDVAFVADLALREKQIQQNYRPPIAVHKWFARRLGTLFRVLSQSPKEESPMQYELTLKVHVQSPYGADRVVRQMEAVFEHGTVKEAIAEGLRLLPDPRLLNVAIRTLPPKAGNGGR